MISPGSRTPVALAIALALTACGSDDGPMETGFTTVVGDGDGDPSGDGDGDPSSGDGDGDGDGDSSSGDGDGDPETGDGDGDGDGDPVQGACPNGGSIVIEAQFYDDVNMLAPLVFEECVMSYGDIGPGGLLLQFNLESDAVMLVLRMPKDLSEGVYPVSPDDIYTETTLQMSDGVPSGWLGPYDDAAGSIELLDYVEQPGHVAEFQIEATMVNGSHSVDISAHGFVELQ